MKINNDNNLNFPDDNGKKHINKKSAQQEQKSAEASSLDALSAQGRAQVAFKGIFKKKKPKSESDLEFYIMSHKEFETLDKKIKEQIKSLPSTVRWKIPPYNIENIKLVEKIVFNKNLYNNPFVLEYTYDLINHTYDDEIAQIRCRLLDSALDNDFIPKQHLMPAAAIKNKKYDTLSAMNFIYNTNCKEQADIAEKFFSDKHLYSNKNVQEILNHNFSYITTPEVYKITDKVLSDKKLYNNDNVVKILNARLPQISIPETYKIADKILSDEKLYDNKLVADNIGCFIPWDLNNAKMRYELSDKILSNEKIYNNENIMNDVISLLYQTETQEGVKLADIIISDEKIFSNQELMKNIKGSLWHLKSPEYELVHKILSNSVLYSNDRFMDDFSMMIISADTPEKAEIKCKLIDKILSDENIYKDENIVGDLRNVIYFINTQEQFNLANKVLSNEKLYNNKTLRTGLPYICHDSAPVNIPIQCKMIDKLFENEKIYNNENVEKSMKDIIWSAKTPEIMEARSEIIDKILCDKKIYNNKYFMQSAGDIIAYTNLKEFADARCSLIDKIFSDEKIYNNEKFMNYSGAIIHSSYNQDNTDIKNGIIDKIFSDEKFYNNENIMNNIGNIIAKTDKPEQVQVINKLLSDEKLYNDENILKKFSTVIDKIGSDLKVNLADKILSDEKYYTNENIMENIWSLFEYSNHPTRYKLANEILNNERLTNDKAFMQAIGRVLSSVKSPKDSEKLLANLNNNELTPIQGLILFLNENNDISFHQFKKLNKVMKDEASKLNEEDTIIAAKFIDVYKKENINEIPIYAKREFLRNLVAVNTGMFELSDEMKEYFPILPKNQEEYCSLLPSIVRSLGIETNTLSDNQIKDFNKNLTEISASLSALSNIDFNNLEIYQSYDKDTFITNVKDILSVFKDKHSGEIQKVYDYFGFELKENKEAKTGYSITGYPVNLNNGHKLAQITNPDTRKIIEKLRPLVIDFSQNNYIQCNNKEIESELNKIVSVLPELRPLIGKVQAGNIKEYGAIVGRGSHDFDVFKHSLKVMQKIVQNPEYNSLNESDKKIMLLASLLHDITKKEGYTDHTHAREGSFDAYYISKKFKLSRDEEIKLYSLIKHHEWLGYVNTADDEKDLTKRLQNTAYDLRHDNMLDMALIFTHADLKSVKKDDSFHDRTDGRGRKVIDGQIRSFGECADIYANKMRDLIEQLKPSQPLLPVTPIPKASTINKEITKVKSDGSTNIKGIYKDKDGLIVIKFNELENEDLEKIGFPKGSTVKGIMSKTSAGDEVNTGNVKFFAHGLEYSNQLIKFDAFSLPDSDALLSVSYSERPESKYRFFRPQGVILDCETKYIHGGGNTDSGSGCGKNIQEFKDNYIFGGEREADRTYISSLIKDATGMTDKEYIKFVKENENKPISEIKPESLRTKIINAFASINSNKRKGNREYNEIYISNPKPPMAVFAYNMDNSENTGNPVAFLNRTPTNDNSFKDKSVYERTKFLREYALERDIPFVVFGD